MSITSETVQKVAQISRLNLSEREVEEFQKDLNSILDMFAVLDTLDTTDVEPSFLPITSKEPTTRNDEVAKSISREDALVGENEDGFFIGPKVR